MPNKTYAGEWLDIAKRNVETARLLFDVKHYNDVIAIDIHQTIEKSLKAMYAYNGVNVPRSHSLLTLFEYVGQYIDMSDIGRTAIIEISDYYQSDRYPGPKYFIPENDEIERNLQVALSIFNRIQRHIDQ